MTKKKVLLIGPRIGNKKSFYGGGIGGYTRNMALYLREFQFEEISLVPFYSTSRMRGEIKFISFPIRFFKDIIGFLFKITFEKIDAIHILGQYRSAIPREAAWVTLAKLFGFPVVYEIKAGMFISASQQSKLHKLLSSYIIKQSDLILAEGEVYLKYLYSEYRKNAIYFPNVVAINEIPPLREVHIQNPLKILFVGFCYEGKGIFDLVKSLQTDKIKYKIELEIIGGESNEFTEWVDKLPSNPRVKIVRYGKQPHSFVLDRMKQNTIYLYPSRHSGEGHNNTINEAMMNSMIIISSNAGFLEDILKDCGYLIDVNINPEINIQNAIIEIINNPEIAIKLAQNGRNKIETTFNSEVQGRVLETQYRKVIYNK